MSNKCFGTLAALERALGKSSAIAVCLSESSLSHDVTRTHVMTILLRYQYTPNDHLLLELIYRSAFIENPSKVILSESLRIEDYEDVSICS